MILSPSFFIFTESKSKRYEPSMTKGKSFNTHEDDYFCYASYIQQLKINYKRMKRKFNALLFFMILVFLLPANLKSQNHARNWYFGNNAGLVFEGRYPMPLMGGQMNSREGVASISDSLGNLLFYSDGRTVWNMNHEIIADDLAGDPLSTMSATILPSRINDNQYILFTTSVIVNGFDGPEVPEGGHYYIFDFSEANPGGLLVQDYTSLGTSPVQKRSVEKFLGIPYPESIIADTLNQAGYWLLSHEFDRFTYKVSQFVDKYSYYTEIDIGQQHGNGTDDFGANRGATGYIAASIQGDKVAVAIEGQKMIEVFRFNNKTGQLRNLLQLPAGDPEHKKDKTHGSYGLAFSPSGRFLYGTSRDGGILYQWDFKTMNTVAEVYILRNNPDIPCGALQLAPNGKIYLAIDGQDYLGVINRPDRLGKRAAFEEYGARLINNDTGEGGSSTLGLPQFDMSDYEVSHFGYDHNCYGDTTVLYMNSGVAGGYSSNATFTIIDPESGGIYNIIQADQYLMARWLFPKPGEYDIRVQGRHNGINLDFIERISILEPPQVSLTEKDYTIMCRGDTLELNAGNGAFYEWADESFRDRSYFVTEEDFEIGLIQEFRVRVVDYAGCVGWDTIQVEIKSPPEVNFEYTKAICGEANGSATVIPTGQIENYYFRWEDFPDNTTNKIENVHGGEYVVYVTSRFAGCEASKLAIVPELGGANVEIVASADSMVCPNTEIVLSIEGEGEFEYNWINPDGENGRSVVVRPEKTSTYSVEVTASDEGRVCTVTKSYTVLVSENHPLDLGDDLSACEGDTISVDASSDDYLSWNWSNDLTGPIIELYESDEELILLVVDENGCEYTDVVSAIFHPAPTVELGKDRSYCSNDPISLFGGMGDSYLWSTGETVSEIQINQSGIYSLQITEFTCENSDTVEIFFLNPDSLRIDTVDIQDITCFEANDGQIEVKVHGMGSHFMYSIDGGETYLDNDGLFENLLPGDNYQLKVMEDSVCYKVYDLPIEIVEPDDISFGFQMSSPSCAECLDGSILLTGLKGGTKPYTIQWNTLDYGIRLSGIGIGQYSVHISDSLNCTKSDIAFLDMGFKIPNAFTPNGDGTNETWEIKLLNIYPQVVVKVFDTNGRLVFESPQGYPEPWDGTFEGSALPMGTYYYMILLRPDEKPYTGTLTILR